jgi:hypothetical protein
MKPTDTERLATSVRALTKDGLLKQLADLLTEQVGDQHIGTIGRHAPSSSEPWNSEAAAAYWKIHFGVRRLEKLLFKDAFPGKEARARGGSYDNTVDALDRLPALAAQACGEMVGKAADAVERWVQGARQIHDIDETDKWVPVPQIPGALPPVCPYCRTLSLRMSKERGEVRCFFPDCVDLDEKPTKARMEFGRVSGEGMLIFGDGTVVHFRPTEENGGSP